MRTRVGYLTFPMSLSPTTVALSRLASPQNFHTAGYDAGKPWMIPTGARSPAHARFIAGQSLGRRYKRRNDC